MSLLKNELRLIAKKKIAAISYDDFQKKSLAISLNILSLLKEVKESSKFNFFPSVLIGVYAPLKDEPYWPLAFKDEDVRLSFPTINETGKGLSFIETSLDTLEISTEFGTKILSPQFLLKESKVKEVMPDILIIPGLGFSKKGERLGRGKGFYDRFLADFNGVKIGISFDESIFEIIPTESHDETLHYVVTESEVFKI